MRQIIQRDYCTYYIIIIQTSILIKKKTSKQQNLLTVERKEVNRQLHPTPDFNTVRGRIKVIVNDSRVLNLKEQKFTSWLTLTTFESKILISCTGMENNQCIC